MSNQIPEPKTKFAPTLPDWLSYLYQPILPVLKKIKIHRQGRRQLNPQDILLPQGYVAEVVATGFNAPVHCCFDDAGACYVVESGHKIEVPPRSCQFETTSVVFESFCPL